MRKLSDYTYKFWYITTLIILLPTDLKVVYNNNVIINYTFPAWTVYTYTVILVAICIIIWWGVYLDLRDWYKLKKELKKFHNEN